MTKKDFKEFLSIIKNKEFVEEDQVEQLQCILDKNPELANTVSEYMQIPLLTAAAENKPKIVKFLLEHTNNNVVRKHIHISFLAAISRGYFEVAKEFLKHGADVNAVSKNGWTSLLIATSEGKLEIVKFLLEHGADVNTASTDGWGWTPLLIAASGSKLEIIKLLLEHGAHANAKNQMGRTSLSYIALRGCTEIAKLLIEYTLVQNSNEKKQDFLNKELSDHWDGCEAEIKKMKNQKVGDSEILFYDIIKANKDELVSYMNNEDVMKELNAIDYKEFPMYANKMKVQLNKIIPQKIITEEISMQRLSGVIVESCYSKAKACCVIS